MPNKNKTIFQDLLKLILSISLIVGVGAVLSIMFYTTKNEIIDNNNFSN